MNKIKCSVDSSAIISLGATDSMILASDIFSFVASLRVKEELIDISKTEDEIGKIARHVLDSSLIEFVELDKELENVKGEIETVNLANKIKADFVIMDDIKARKKLEDICNVPIVFSPFIIFVLYEKNILSYEESLSAIKKMKIKRKWKDNLVMEYAKMLFEKESGL